MREFGEIEFVAEGLPVLVEVFEAEDAVDEEGVAVEDVSGLGAKMMIDQIIWRFMGRSGKGEKFHAVAEAIGIVIGDPLGIESLIVPAGNEASPRVSGNAEAEVSLFSKEINVGFSAHAGPGHFKGLLHFVVRRDEALGDAEGDADGSAGVFGDADEGEFFIGDNRAEQHAHGGEREGLNWLGMISMVLGGLIKGGMGLREVVGS